MSEKTLPTFEWDEEADEYFALVDGERLFLSDDDDNARRIFALRLHLDNWKSPITEGYAANYFEVNNCQVRQGMSFEEARENIALLRAALDKTKFVTFGPFGGNQCKGITGNETLASLRYFVAPQVNDEHPEVNAIANKNIRMDSYHAIHAAIQKEAFETLLEGFHTVANTLYHITGGYDQKQWHCRLLSALWDGREIDDERPWETVNSGEYRVLTDYEADEAWDEDLNNYIDDCLEIPDHVRPYFNEEQWKADARTDGRGHSLGRYDGREYEVQVEDETFYIYRQN